MLNISDMSGFRESGVPLVSDAGGNILPVATGANVGFSINKTAVPTQPLVSVTAAGKILVDPTGGIFAFDAQTTGITMASAGGNPTISLLTAGNTRGRITGSSVRFNILQTSLAGDTANIGTYLYSPVTATLQLGGPDVAAPVAQILRVTNVVTGTTDTAGANFTIAGSSGTGTGAGGSIIFQTAPASGTGNTPNALATAVTITSPGNVGVGVTPTAVLHLKAGTATANTAPLKLNSGTLNTAAEAGAVEFLTDAYYGTVTTGAIRKMVVMGTTGRATAQTAANASVATYTLGAEDQSFEVSANILVTTSNAEAFTVTCAYTDEGNTARTLTMPFVLLAGTTTAAIGFANGAVPYEGIPIHIRCKASTVITIATTGTFTGATYNAEAIIKRTA